MIAAVLAALLATGTPPGRPLPDPAAATTVAQGRTRATARDPDPELLRDLELLERLELLENLDLFDEGR